MEKYTQTYIDVYRCMYVRLYVYISYQNLSPLCLKM